jgi:hypothetical protein
MDGMYPLHGDVAVFNQECNIGVPELHPWHPVFLALHRPFKVAPEVHRILEMALQLENK